MTLNQLIDKIQALGNAHEMIATTFNGPVMDRLALGDVTYPLMTFDVNTARAVPRAKVALRPLDGRMMPRQFGPSRRLV